MLLSCKSAATSYLDDGLLSDIGPRETAVLDELDVNGTSEGSTINDVTASEGTVVNWMASEGTWPGVLILQETSLPIRDSELET